MLILLFLIGVVKLAPHMKLHQGASINYQLNIYYVLIDYRLLNRQWYIECIMIMIIINLIIDKSRLCYKITKKY